MHTTHRWSARFALGETLEVLRNDQQRRAAVFLAGIAGGLMVACLVAHDSGAGADAFAYWSAVRTWLAGGDPYHPATAIWPYAYPIWMLPIFLPWALLPWPLAWFIWRTAMVNRPMLCWASTSCHPMKPTVRISAAPLDEWRFGRQMRNSNSMGTTIHCHATPVLITCMAACAA
jgi:hypothetical protein